MTKKKQKRFASYRKNRSRLETLAKNSQGYFLKTGEIHMGSVLV